MSWGTRRHGPYWAFLAQRISGVVLALYLPAHFWVLHLALEGEPALDGFLRWTESPLVKVAEAGLVVLLSSHLIGGLRLLLVELLPWRDWQKNLIAVAVAGSLGMGALFLLRAL